MTPGEIIAFIGLGFTMICSSFGAAMWVITHIWGIDKRVVALETWRMMVANQLAFPPRTIGARRSTANFRGERP